MADKKDNKVYRDGLGKITNPATTLFGKILIWTLAILMFAGLIVALVFALIDLL